MQCSRADVVIGSGVKRALTKPEFPDCCRIYHNIQETNCRGNSEEAVLCGVSICLDVFLWRLLQLRECYQCFGQDTVVAIVGEPQWLALIPRAWVQSISTAVAQWRYSSSQVSLRLWCRHSLTFNTQSKPGELQLWCVRKSWVLRWAELLESFPNKWVHVFSPQKTVELPLLSRPIILADYERTPPPLHTQHSLEPFIILILVLGRLVRLFWDCSPFFLVLSYNNSCRLVWLVSVGNRKNALFYAYTHWERNKGQPQNNVSFSAFVHSTVIIISWKKTYLSQNGQYRND